MSVRNCPRCMQKLSDSSVCACCGFHPEEYQAPANALPIGTVIGHCIIGIVLAESRQAVCYSAFDSNIGQPVLLEEFFPAAAVKRNGKDVVQSRPGARFAEAVERFASEEATGRETKPIAVIKDNNTVYREYPLSLSKGQAPEQAADALLDNPIRFRNQDNNPVFSVNALEIPPLPERKTIRFEKPGRGRKGLVIVLILLLLVLAGLFAVWKLGILKLT